MNAPVLALYVFNGELYAGGQFDTAGSISANKIAKWNIATDTKENFVSDGISVFPNPSKENITIILPEKATIEILDMEGQIIKTISNNNLTITIDLRNLSSGIYILKANTDKGILIKRFIKQ